MATIPSATRLERANPSGQQRVATIDTSNADGGLKSFGEDLTRVARDIKSIEQADRQSALDGADIASTVALEEIKNAYNDDPDFETVGERSEAQIQESLNAIAEGIAHPADRARWLQAQEVARARARTHLGKVVAVKQRDHARAGIDEQTQQLRTAALTSENPAEVVAMYERRMESAVAAGHVTAQERQTMESEFKARIAVDRLERLPPEQLTQALKEDWAKNLPPDEILRLERKAEVEGAKDQAYSTVDAMYVENPALTLEEGFSQIDQIEDRQERELAETRFRRVHADKEAALTQKQLKSYDEAMRFVEEGGMVDNVPEEVIESLSPTQRGNLSNLEAQMTGQERKVSDPEAYDYATTLASRGDWGGLQRYLSQFGSQLKPSDRSKFADAAAEGAAPSEVTQQQLIASRLPGTDETSKQGRVQMLPRINQWANDYKAAYGKEPSQAEIEKEIDRRMKPVVNPDGGYNLWWDFDSPIYEIEDAEIRDKRLEEIHVEELQQTYGESFNNGVAYMRTQGVEANRHQLERVVKTQAEIDGLRARNNPEIQSVIEDVDEGFEQRGVTPTQEQWLNAVTRIARGRNATQP